MSQRINLDGDYPLEVISWYIWGESPNQQI